MTRSSTNRQGTSRRVRIEGPDSSREGSGSGFFGHLSSRTLGLAAMAAERRRTQERLRALETSLGREARKDLADLRREEHPEDDMPNIEDMPLVNDDGDDDWVEEPELAEESITHAIRDLLGNRVQTSRVRQDNRTWRDRIKRLEENWQVMLPYVLKAYKRWRYGDCTPDPEVLPTTTQEIAVIDIYDTATTLTYNRYPGNSIAEDLALNGYLATAPLHPELAISFRTLELFRCIRLFKPSFSTEAFAKLLCYMYIIPYRRFYRTALADAFDIYLMLLRDVKAAVMEALGRDAPGWRAKNACPACAYKVAGEEPATFNRMIVMDGNNSLKRVATSGGRAAADLRVFEDNDYFLPRAFVDSYANEVKSRQAPRKPDLVDDYHDMPELESDDETPPETEGDPTDGAETIGACASNWKAAAADEKKRMWSIYEESGIFGSACRHSIILWIADMVRSGELAKYGLATTAKVLTDIGGKNMHGYDIGCEFLVTVNNSSIGDAFKASESQFCVNAFHGYSHAYTCQVNFHPNRIPGMGLEDLETMERIFSASNQLASVTRYASPYRRRVLIAMFFEHWDFEKYANIGLMLYNNYRQALEIIEEKTPMLAEAMAALQITEDDLRRYQQEERQYFTTLRDEDPEDLRDVLYVEALHDLWTTSQELKDTSARYYDRTAQAAEAAARAESSQGLTFLTPTSGPTTYEADLSATRKLETRRRYLRDRVDQLTADVNEIEVRLGIEKRWDPMDERYQKATAYIATRTYQRALGRLQRLVIQRLFELHKMNIAQTGYKARTYIAKNLQRRCKAIRTAVKAYNTAASAMNPPRETIDWSSASHYNFIEQFPFLQDTRNDLREKSWSAPAVREVMRLSERLARAHEEIRNVHRELRRLQTWIRDEEHLFKTVLAYLKDENTVLYAAVLEFWRRRRTANVRNTAYIEATHALPGFSGDREPGTHDGPSLLPPHLREAVLPENPSELTATDRIPAEENAGPYFGDDEDEMDEQVTGLLDFMHTLSV